MKFASLGLKQPILRGVTAAGFDQPTEIQERVIPAAMKGLDLIALAETGSGKTAAYGLPILDRLYGGQPGLRALILVPTRELCVQVADNLRIYSRYTDLHVCTAFGGINIGIQEAAFRRGLDVLIACPGRLIDHLQCGNFDLDRVETLVLDEADRMLDMGFMPQIRRILARMPKQRQNFLLSATMPKEIETLVTNNFGETMRIQVGCRSQAASTITHHFEELMAADKEPMLERVLNRGDGRVLIFVKTKVRAEELGRKLKRSGLPADSIHGDKSAESRYVVLQAFSRGKTRHLVATDVAARGIDVSDIYLVVNFDMPRAVDDYIHRVGRTGRAGNEGEALTMVTRPDRGILKQILAHLQKEGISGRPIYVDGKHINGKQADGGQADSKQADGKQADGGQADGKQADGRQASREARRRSKPQARDRREPSERHPREAPAERNNSPRPRRKSRDKMTKEQRRRKVAGGEVSLSSHSMEPHELAKDVLFGDSPASDSPARDAPAGESKPEQRPSEQGRRGGRAGGSRPARR